MEYNLKNAFNAGFDHVVFVIRPSLQQTLVGQVLPRLPTEISVDIVLQTLEELPSDCRLPVYRTKPLGTAHAVWCCRHVLRSSFAVINADDYYGKQAFRLLVQKTYTSPNDHLMVSYSLGKTLSSFGDVNRGICNIDERDQLVSVEEYENIAENAENILGTAHKTNQTVRLSPESPTSMNCWYLNADIFPLLEAEVRSVLSNQQANTEAFLPSAIMKQINMFGKQVTVVKSSERWFGVTYPEDVALVNDNIDVLFEESEHLLSKDVKRVLSNYGINSSEAKIESLGDGHINQTYKLTIADDIFVLQKINHQIFTSPHDLSQNTQSINQYLLEQKRTGIYQLKVPQQFLSKTQKLFVSHNENYWRLMEYVADSYTVDQVTSSMRAKQAAQAFASFSNALQFFPAKKLNTILKDFHNLDVRIKQLRAAIENNIAGRLGHCREIVEEILCQQDFIVKVAKIIPKLPIRVTHNDTKINNLLFSNQTNQPCAVIDLDTCMPGYLMYDFGDMVRTCCANLMEDATDIENMVFSLEIFEALVDGYRYAFDGGLSMIERQSLIIGARLLPFIIGIRFTTDYLNGDKYFTVKHEQHNLERAENQLCLYKLISRNETEISRLVLKQDANL